jgi:anti-sigma regulatory factor (Ser/Thr protein kinase)
VDVSRRGEDQPQASALVSFRHWQLQPDPAVLLGLRAELRALFATWAVPDEAGEDVLLVITELVANVIDHAGTPFELTVRIGGIHEGTMQITVEDGSVTAPMEQPHDPYSARGRGLQIVGHVAARWGFKTHQNGKSVWANVDLGTA